MLYLQYESDIIRYDWDITFQLKYMLGIAGGIIGGLRNGGSGVDFRQTIGMLGGDVSWGGAGVVDASAIIFDL
jgi:hypothetical protein